MCYCTLFSDESLLMQFLNSIKVFTVFLIQLIITCVQHLHSAWLLDGRKLRLVSTSNTTLVLFIPNFTATPLFLV